MSLCIHMYSHQSSLWQSKNINNTSFRTQSQSNAKKFLQFKCAISKLATSRLWSLDKKQIRNKVKGPDKVNKEAFNDDSMFFLTCSKSNGEASLAQRAIEAAKEENNADSPTMPITDHSCDLFPVTPDEWANRNSFAEDKTIRSLLQNKWSLILPWNLIHHHPPPQKHLLSGWKVIQQILHHS